MHVKGNRVVACGIKLKGDTLVVSVLVGGSEGGAWSWGSGNADVVHKFGKLGDWSEAQGVVGAESHAGSGDGFPIRGTVVVAKCLAGGDEEVVTYEESLSTDDVRVILGLPEGTSSIVLGRIDFLVGKGKAQVINAGKV